MGALIRYNLTRTAKYTNVPYQHTGRMTRLKISFSIQPYSARDLRERPLLIHVDNLHQTRGSSGKSPSNNWNFQITHLLTNWAHANVCSDKLT